MDIIIRNGEGVRVLPKSGFTDVFIDVRHLTNPFGQCMSVDLYRLSVHVLKVKDDNYKMFTFANKEDMDNFDYGYWEDAETIWKSCQ